MTNGGEGTSGHKQSPETIAKRVLKNTGKKRTEESRSKISKSLKGKTLSEETKLKLSKIRKGTPRNPELVKRTADSNRGKKRSKEFCELRSQFAKLNSIKTNLSQRTIDRNMDKTIYKFTHPNIGEFIGTRVDFCNKYGIKPATLQNYFNRESQKTVLGWSIEEYYEQTKYEKNP